MAYESAISRRGVAVLAAWTLVAMLFAGQAWFAAQVRGEPLAWARASVIWLVWAAAWAALTPIVLRLAARFPLQRGHGGTATFTHADGMAEARGWRDAFPDLDITVDKQVAERDLVAVRWTARGTNTGTGNGLPATGRAVQITGTTLFRMDDGRIAEEWTCANSLGLMKQLGMLQTTAAAPSTGGNAAGAKTP